MAIESGSQWVQAAELALIVILQITVILFLLWKAHSLSTVPGKLLWAAGSVLVIGLSILFVFCAIQPGREVKSESDVPKQTPAEFSPAGPDHSGSVVGSVSTDTGDGDHVRGSVSADTGDSGNTTETSSKDMGSDDIVESAITDYRALSDQTSDGLVAIYTKEFSSLDGYRYQTSWTTHGEPEAIVYEDDDLVRFLRYDRESDNKECLLYVYYEAEKEDGGYSPMDAHILEMYAYVKESGEVIASGRRKWEDIGSPEYREATGE
ncbi:MAG: hypothetical protein IIU07_00495 [Lachnospiraceae bacterium]|nr:hypothetical protein [Lachnospiraceae bacterium]